MIPSTKTQVLHYLLERGLLAHRTIVDGKIKVADLSSRHRNYAVMREGERGYFVKQSQPWHANSAETLMREAACYQLVQSDPAFAALRPLVPRLFGFDPIRMMLTLELLPEAESLGSYFRRVADFPARVGEKFGAALGAYHAHLDVPLQEPRYRQTFPLMQPWILSLHLQQPHAMQNLSQANAQLMGMLRHYPEFAPALDRLRGSWQNTALIHGDIKFENVVVSFPQESGEPELKIIDWETADIGDPGWDVGSVFQSFLSFWVFSLPLTAGVAIEQAVERAPYPLERMHPAAHAFWDAYCRAANVDSGRGALLERCVTFGAARLLQTVFESMASMQQLSAHAVLASQASLNVIQDPAKALRELFGM
ncbi:MAG TPA: aminoglycoside phosphotransferase family protein [Bryobacteraceae bacterium]|nr:aminoglycoside phosphotransferase family protein [Bryobacteraceae bacterium]